MAKMLLVFLIVAVTATSVFAYTVRLELDDVKVVTVDDMGFKGYTAVSLDGGYVLPVEPGEPALPGLPVAVALPQGTEIESVNVTYSDPVALPGSYKVLPMQEPEKVGAEPDSVVLPDTEIYSSSALFPGEYAYSFESGNMGGYHVGNVILAPVQYIPATGELFVYREIDFNLNLTPARGNLVYPKYRLAWIDRYMTERLESTVINPEDVMSPAGTVLIDAGDKMPDDIYPYLIIVKTGLEEGAENLALWKTKKGLKAKVLSTDEVIAGYSGVDTEEQIRNCIIDYYENCGTQFVCFIGPTLSIPMRKAYDPSFDVAEGNHLVPTDNYYGCLDGDWNADGDGYWGEYPSDNVDFNYDVFVGRMQVSTVSYANEVVDKTLCYEGTELSSEDNPYDYNDQVLLAAGWLDGSTNGAEGKIFIKDNYMQSPFWGFTELYDSSFTASAFINEMNEGKGVINHGAHSNTTILGTESGYVSATDLYNLTNHPRFTAFLYTYGCYAANTDSPFNCGAYFVSSPEGGGVGFVGNTRYGWYAGGSWFLHTYSQLFDEEYFHQLGVVDDYINGSTLASHKHSLVGYASNAYYRYIYYELFLTGDPDIWVPTDTVYALNPTYATETGIGPQTYDVHVADSSRQDVEGALVCVWKDDEVYTYGETDSIGNVSFNIEPTSEGTMYLTACAHNSETYEAEVTVEGYYVTVKLESFTGKRIKEGVRLDWSVTNDEDVDYFNLYRRVASAAADIEPVGTEARVSSAADKVPTAVKRSIWYKVNEHPITGDNPYTYLDRGVSDREYEYRLEAVLNDTAESLGRALVSGDVPVVFGLKIAPNPGKSVVNLGVGLPEKTTVKLTLYDLTGRKIYEPLNGPMEAGEHNVALDATNLSAGVYIVRLDAGDMGVTVKRVVITR
jgi:hypothetical protein